MIVPVMSSGSRVRNWAVLGVRLIRVSAEYAVPPLIYDLPKPRRRTVDVDVGAVNAAFESGSGLVDKQWDDTEYLLPVYAFAEIERGPEPLTREEYRSICSRYETEAEIIAALKLSNAWWNRPGAVYIAIGGALAALLLWLLGTAAARRRRRAA